MERPWRRVDRARQVITAARAGSELISDPNACGDADGPADSVAGDHPEHDLGRRWAMVSCSVGHGVFLIRFVARKAFTVRLTPWSLPPTAAGSERHERDGNPA